MSYNSRPTFRKLGLKSSGLLPMVGLKKVVAPSVDGSDETYTVLFEKKAEYGKPVYK
ncbi:hypothetical protein [Paenibacillus pini]|uniref:Uncharacterized protein n=1 Tax=Paenibacillus pini JCM 16418 TaxID=1236976 RepID=W7YV88_9BACL|nr:hypothetical protein [Paenibacillus pini]GAF08521.1 hypothetical protein JCM16418_2603 [Paenibacillus pini JCM 16418]